MTDETTPPSTGPGGPGGDGAATAPPTGEDAEAQVTARRLRELQKTTGQLREATEQHGEQLASVGEQLHELGEQLARTSARHADLAAAVSEDLAPRVGGLQQVVTEELGQLRGDVDVLLNERKEREKTKNAPVDWAALTAEQAAVQWPVLARWVGEVLVPRYEVTRDELPDCWALHLPVVAELSWLRTAYVQAYLSRSPPQMAADWHTRWRPAVLTRIRDVVNAHECVSRQARAAARHAGRGRSAQNGAMPRTQLAEPQFWWPFYDRAYHLDLAARRTRAAAGDVDWSPAEANDLTLTGRCLPVRSCPGIRALPGAAAAAEVGRGLGHQVPMPRPVARSWLLSWSASTS